MTDKSLANEHVVSDRYTPYLAHVISKLNVQLITQKKADVMVAT